MIKQPLNRPPSEPAQHGHWFSLSRTRRHVRSEMLNASPGGTYDVAVPLLSYLLIASTYRAPLVPGVLTFLPLRSLEDAIGHFHGNENFWSADKACHTGRSGNRIVLAKFVPVLRGSFGVGCDESSVYFAYFSKARYCTLLRPV